MSDILNKIKLKLILVCHILLVCFVVISPFLNSNFMLLMHLIIVPFIMVHWLLNNNICALTLMEKKLREKIYGTTENQEDCFTCKIIEPVYDFKKNYKHQSTAIYGITTLLILITLIRLFHRYKCGYITKFHDLFILY